MQEREGNLNDGNRAAEIRLSFQTPDQIFIQYTPVPSLEKELSPATEEYLVDMVRDIPVHIPVRIALHVPAPVAAFPEILAVPSAIRDHFHYRIAVADRQYRHMLRFGKRSFLIAIAILALAMFVSQAIVMHFGELLYIVMIAEGATVVSWVALWAPASILVLELWPIREKRRIFQKIAGSEIVIVAEP